jgi:hypothetical protein
MLLENAVPKSCIRKSRLVLSNGIVSYMKDLLLVESFDLRPSNQYVLVRVFPSCFRFCENVSRCSPRYLSSSWESCALLIWTGGHVSLRVVDPLSFIFQFLKKFRNCKLVGL